MSVYRIKGQGEYTCTRHVIVTMEELGLEYEIDSVNLNAGESKTSEHMERFHPFGLVPVLIDGDFQLFESRAIMRYLVTKHTSTLYPADAKTRGLVEQWLSVNQSQTGAVVDAIMEYRVKPLYRGATPDDSKLPEWKETINFLLKVLDRQLASTGAFLAGDDFTLADIPFMSYFGYLIQLGPFIGLFESYPNVNRWWESITSRPSWQKAVTIN